MEPPDFMDVLGPDPTGGLARPHALRRRWGDLRGSCRASSCCHVRGRSRTALFCGMPSCTSVRQRDRGEGTPAAGFFS